MSKILVADDSKAIRIILKAMVLRLGYEFTGEATNGLDAFNKYQELNPDIVIMDIIMPVLDGVKSLEKIKEFDPEAIVIMTTSNAYKERLTEALDLGARDFILKPITEGKLKDLLDRIK